MLTIQQQQQPMPGVMMMPENQMYIQQPQMVAQQFPQQQPQMVTQQFPQQQPQMVTQQFPQQQVPMAYPQPMQYTTANPAQIVPIVMQQPPVQADQSMALTHDNSHMALNNTQNDMGFQKTQREQQQPAKEKEYTERPDVSICAGVRSCCTRTLKKLSDCLHFLGNFTRFT